MYAPRLPVDTTPPTYADTPGTSVHAHSLPSQIRAVYSREHSPSRSSQHSLANRRHTRIHEHRACSCLPAYSFPAHVNTTHLPTYTVLAFLQPHSLSIYMCALYLPDQVDTSKRPAHTHFLSIRITCIYLTCVYTAHLPVCRHPRSG